ncbi:hypothetical protein J4573_29810 [Actinomadura barringtoniae]|uniref:Mce-associated membrane protein n=1 Tax=Actinomadura barringtoniae TaxID=1427535 RepID=A0A939PFL2_9ACTN|nr:hypothetical protein [Actinomadura barringtoniae]MBO2451322.1 hypothetical protein [Actinomadura barringtoniae]
MTMKGAEKADTPAKGGKPANGNGSKAATQAEKALEAERAAKLAEEAAERAREAARLAQAAATAAADAEAAEAEAEAAQAQADADAKLAEAEEAGEADTTDETVEVEDADGTAEKAEIDDLEADAPESGIEEKDSADADGTGDGKISLTKADDDEDEEQADDEAELGAATVQDAPKRRLGGVRRVLTPLTAGLLVLVIALGAGVVTLALKVRDQKATEKATSQAVFAASRAAQDLSSFDYRTLDDDFKTASGQTTGKLRNDYDKLAAQVRSTATTQQAVATTTVIKVGAVSASPKKVVVFVYANRSTAKNTDKEKALPEPLRMRMTMVKVDGKWLASDLQVISA